MQEYQSHYAKWHYYLAPFIVPHNQPKRGGYVRMSQFSTALYSVTLFDRYLQLVKSFPPAIGNPYFFRHNEKSGQGKRHEGKQFGPKLFYKYWKQACENLGIEGVDLYGGTRHSSATALGTRFSPEQIKRATLHSTSKAFDRYFQSSADNLRELYEEASVKVLSKKNETPKKRQVIDFTKES
jgi:hypothetical protein